MKRASGWVLIVAGFILGVLTVPAWNVSGQATNGSVRIDSNPAATSLDGHGEFRIEMSWTVSYTMLLICCALSLGGVALVRSNRVPARIA